MGLGLLRSDKDGYHFTAEGVRFLRKWLPERRQVTDVTGPVRSDGLSQESGGAEPLPSRTGGDMSDIGDLEKSAPNLQEKLDVALKIFPLNPNILSVKTNSNLRAKCQKNVHAYSIS
jgi:hypothetical protein